MSEKTKCRHDTGKFLSGHDIGKLTYTCSECGALVSFNSKNQTYPWIGMLSGKPHESLIPLKMIDLITDSQEEGERYFRKHGHQDTSRHNILVLKLEELLKRHE